jgi:hypothetical protein
MAKNKNTTNNSAFILFKTEDESVSVDVRFDDETVWLTQDQMAMLFDKAKSTISEHIKHIFEEGELQESAVVRNFRTTAADGKNYEVNYFNLDVIISIGYRVRSFRGTQFRQWATKRLNEYIRKGFTMVSIEFFKKVQNKIHFAVHGQTAAEVIFNRADAEKEFIGLMTFTGTQPHLKDVVIAKNYLDEKELRALGQIVSYRTKSKKDNMNSYKNNYTHIVSILDKCDTLTASISEGLSKEIALRKHYGA